MKKTNLLAIAALALIGCGDNHKGNPDAKVADSNNADAAPAAPTLGMQIDRMGRAAVNTVLNHGFDPTAAAQTAKTAYNETSDLTGWFAQASLGEYMKNLAFIDALDTTSTATGCGNQAYYNNGAGGTANAMSYLALAGVLANDQLFLDSSKATCGTYLAVEGGTILGSYSSCGGRAPDYDVVDFSYSMLAAGLNGFVIGTTLTPKIGDGVSAHTYLADFPYLNVPN